MLVLPIKKKWFEMIVAGKKKEEYREIKPYYDKRFGNILLGYSLDNVKAELYENIEFSILFRNGYSPTSPSVKCLCILNKGYGKQEWGAIKGKEYYILTIIKIIEIKNWDVPKPTCSIPTVPIMNSPMAAAVQQATEEAQNEIEKAIKKQFEIGIDIEEALNRTAEEMKNKMMFGI